MNYNKNNSLIKKAKAYGSKSGRVYRRAFTREQIDACYACAAGDITGKQLCYVLGYKYNSSSVYRAIWWALVCDLRGLN